MFLDIPLSCQSSASSQCIWANLSHSFPPAVNPMPPLSVVLRPALRPLVPLALKQCTLADPLYTGIPLVDPMYTGIPLDDQANTSRVHWNTTGKTWLKLPHWNATGETLTIAAYNGTPLGGGGGGGGGGGDYNSPHAHAHMVKQSSLHASLKWQDGKAPNSRWTCSGNAAFIWNLLLCSAYQVLLFTRVSTSTLLCVCIYIITVIVFVVFWGWTTNEISSAQTSLVIPVANIRSYLT